MTVGRYRLINHTVSVAYVDINQIVDITSIADEKIQGIKFMLTIFKFQIGSEKFEIIK